MVERCRDSEERVGIGEVMCRSSVEGGCDKNEHDTLIGKDLES